MSATGSLTGYSVSKLTTAESVTPTVTSPVFGQPVSFTATVTTGGNATVTPVAPGAGVPTGTVTFTVGGKTAGPVKLPASGTAKLAVKSPGAETASASYSGDASFAPSSASTATKNPKIAAKLTSAHPKTKFGWYRSPVTITFACSAGSAPLTGPCPAPVTLSRSAAAQRVCN
ncbi:MAG TPA: Ig-like domain-containing protein [Streptosporangiaceae bacterium]|nr:Ig-like domain-containing protein [Streptosporangiaceae bacterium]